MDRKIRWNQLIKNLDLAKAAAKIAPIHIPTSTAVQTYNIFQVPDIISFFREREIPVYLDHVHQPTYLALEVLSPKLSENAKLKLQSEIDYPGVKQLIHLLNSTKHHEWNQFISYTKKLDEIHGQDISKVIPELGI